MTETLSDRLRICIASGDGLTKGTSELLREAADELDRRAPDLAEALREMAKQKLLTELDPDELENADVFGGYDEMVKTARAALASRPAMADEVTVPVDDLLFAYRGALVLRAMLKTAKLQMGLEAADELIERLGKIAPELPGLSALRSPASPSPDIGKGK